MATENEHLETDNQIDRYLNGELTQSQVDDLWAEMIQDNAHMDYLQNSANLKALIHRPEDRQTAPRRIWMYAAAAVIGLLITVMAVIQTGLFNQAAPVRPVESIELDYNRSAGIDLPTHSKKKIIRKAIMLFDQNKIEEAVSFLNDHREKAKEVDWITELDITIGTIYYDTDHFNKAAYYFSDVINYKGKVKKLKLEKAYWYLGNSYFQMNQLREAHAAIIKVYRMDGAYSRVAKKYLDALADYHAKLQQSS